MNKDVKEQAFAAHKLFVSRAARGIVSAALESSYVKEAASDNAFSNAPSRKYSKEYYFRKLVNMMLISAISPASKNESVYTQEDRAIIKEVHDFLNMDVGGMFVLPAVLKKDYELANNIKSKLKVPVVADAVEEFFIREAGSNKLLFRIYTNLIADVARKDLRITPRDIILKQNTLGHGKLMA